MRQSAYSLTVQFLTVVPFFKVQLPLERAAGLATWLVSILPTARVNADFGARTSMLPVLPLSSL